MLTNRKIVLDYNFTNSSYLEDITVRVSEIIEKILNQPVQNIEPDLELNIIGLNSMMTVILVVELEEAFNITFDDSELLYSYFSTIHKIVSLLLEKLK